MIRLRYDYDEKLTCSFFSSRRIVSNESRRAIHRSRIVVVSQSNRNCNHSFSSKIRFTAIFRHTNIQKLTTIFQKRSINLLQMFSSDNVRRVQCASKTILKIAQYLMQSVQKLCALLFGLPYIFCPCLFPCTL